MTKSVLPGLVSAHSLPSMYLCLGLPWPSYRILTLALVKLYEVHTVSPLKPVEVPLEGIPSLQSVNCISQSAVIGNLLRLNLIPLSKLLAKMLERGGPITDPWGMIHVTGLHLDNELLTATLGLWAPPNPSSIHQNLCFFSLKAMMLCRTVSNAFSSPGRWHLLHFSHPLLL